MQPFMRFLKLLLTGCGKFLSNILSLLVVMPKELCTLQAASKDGGRLMVLTSEDNDPLSRNAAIHEILNFLSQIEA